MNYLGILTSPWTYMVLGFITLPYIFYHIGIRKQRSRVKEILNQGTGRYGVIKKYSYSSVDHIIEVEELESAGELIKVRVVRVCPNASSTKRSTEKILENDSFNEWVDEKSIIWYNDNTQRIRDEKLEKILKL